LFRKENILPTHIEQPTRIQAAGNMPKLIDEFIGHVNSPAGKVASKKEPRVSVAHMRSPAGWQEPGQTPEFEEYTIVLRGRLRVNYKDGAFDVTAGQAVIAHPGEWIQYSTPDEATEYIAICLPAFSPGTVHRDE
jgi:mannose-6-phosphate isomerase-like protein (cupin superfamily)